MISDICFILAIGRLSQFAYNAIQFKKGPSNEATNTFEKRNVCRKTAMANFWEAATYVVLGIACVFTGK